MRRDGNFGVEPIEAQRRKYKISPTSLLCQDPAQMLWPDRR